MLEKSIEKNEAGKFARSLAVEMDSLWVFLDEHGVEPTNNRTAGFGLDWLIFTSTPVNNYLKSSFTFMIALFSR
jgi:hypothetical protein